MLGCASSTQLSWVAVEEKSRSVMYLCTWTWCATVVLFSPASEPTEVR